MDERTSVRASVVRPRELGPLELSRWRDFQADRLELQHPMLSGGFARAVDEVSDRARVAVFEDGPTVVGFLPFELRVRGIATAIGRKVNTRQGFVHEPGLPWSWPHLLEKTHLDVLELSDLVGPQADPRRSLERVVAPVIDAGAGWDGYLVRIKASKSVKTTLYKERKLRRDHDDVLFESGPAKSGRALRQLVAWKSEQYRRSGWPDPFARHGVGELLEVLAARADDGVRAVGSSLRIDGDLVATDLSLASDTVFAGWFAAHDPEWARVSPGAIRTLRTVEAAFDLGVVSLDLSRGDESYKDSLKTGDAEVATGFVARPTARALAFQAAHVPATGARSYVVRHPQVRTVVRESLKQVGAARESVTRAAAGFGVTSRRQGDGSSRRNES
jgi:CelD/BcsL family acetyltransferase involved in cellulose biosynthesis